VQYAVPASERGHRTGSRAVLESVALAASDAGVATVVAAGFVAATAGKVTAAGAGVGTGFGTGGSVSEPRVPQAMRAMVASKAGAV
jgi:hypothetical protein